MCKGPGESTGQVLFGKLEVNWTEAQRAEGSRGTKDRARSLSSELLGVYAGSAQGTVHPLKGSEREGPGRPGTQEDH